MIKIHREGRWIVLLTIMLLLTLSVLSALFLPYQLNYLSATLSLVILVLVLRFFRVPARRVRVDEAVITAPADGKVVVVEKVEQSEFDLGPCMQVSIFMSIHDVHINYYPVSGTIAYNKYYPGRYLLARHPKSSELNERNSLGIETMHGRVLVRQVAGYVARRIRCYAQPGSEARQGAEMGFIKFGSRLDLFIPVNTTIMVQVGEKVSGGITPLASFK
jgi:phosphatidylserine decarboxylase